MRILYFHQHFSTPRGAGGVRSYQMARALISANHKVTMVCGSYEVGATGLSSPFVDGRRRGFVEGIDVIEFELPYANTHSFLRRTATFLKFSLLSIGLAMREPYDLVFATSTPLTAAIPGIIAKWLRRKPFVFEVRDLWPELPKAMGVISNPLILAGMSVLERAGYKAADRLVALAGGIAVGIERTGVSCSKIAVLPNGCDLEIFGHSSPAPRPSGVRDGDLMAVYAGTHGVANGLDAVVNAADLLKQRGREDIKIVLIGAGKTKPALIEDTLRLGLTNVVFLDPKPKSELASLLAAADIGLQILANVPAFYQGTSPNKFFDYLAAGKPVLNNYPGWISELIEKHECGIVVPPDDPAAFANALETAAANKAELGKMGKAARALAEAEFDRSVLASRFVAWVAEGRQ